MSQPSVPPDQILILIQTLTEAEEWAARGDRHGGVLLLQAGLCDVRDGVPDETEWKGALEARWLTVLRGYQERHRLPHRR